MLENVISPVKSRSNKKGKKTVFFDAARKDNEGCGSHIFVLQFALGHTIHCRL
jgi:hypothetical protein